MYVRGTEQSQTKQMLLFLSDPELQASPSIPSSCNSNKECELVTFQVRKPREVAVSHRKWVAKPRLYTEVSLPCSYPTLGSDSIRTFFVYVQARSKIPWVLQTFPYHKTNTNYRPSTQRHS